MRLLALLRSSHGQDPSVRSKDEDSEATEWSRWNQPQLRAHENTWSSPFQDQNCSIVCLKMWQAHHKSLPSQGSAAHHCWSSQLWHYRKGKFDHSLPMQGWCIWACASENSLDVALFHPKLWTWFLTANGVGLANCSNGFSPPQLQPEPIGLKWLEGSCEAGVHWQVDSFSTVSGWRVRAHEAL